MVPNYRNVHSRKTVITQLGEMENRIPCDRNGSFEPKIIGRYERNADGMEEKILALYACGMSQRVISEQIRGLYGVEISPELVTKVRKRITPQEARRMAERFEWHYTPKFGSWLDVAEIEVGVMRGWCHEPIGSSKAPSQSGKYQAAGPCLDYEQECGRCNS